MRIIRIFLIIFFLIIFYLFYSQFLGPGTSKESKRFVIRLNTTEQEIIGSLWEKGFLKNRTIFTLALTLKNWPREIEPGAYKLAESMSVFQLVDTLLSGPYQKWVVVPPSKRKEQVAVILQKSLDWPVGLAISFARLAEEGYLFPDTYLIDKDADPLEVITKFKNNFNEKFDAKLQKDLFEQNIRNDTAIKIASLIERESGGDEDKPIIAGIIWNRLLKEMKLEIDATVQYALAIQDCQLNLNKSDLWPLMANCNFWPKVTGQDLRTTKSDYNTYLYKGLTPGPICSPGLESIKAVAYPVKTDDLYYLHSPDKQIHTAKTLKEHQDNIEKYLK